MTQSALCFDSPREMTSDCDRIAAIFRQQPGVWISALSFASVCLAWRTRISDLRYAPHLMEIQNKTEQHGRAKHSFYKWVK